MRDFMVDVLRLSAHMGSAGRVLQDYVLNLMYREVSDLEFTGQRDPAPHFCGVYYGEQVAQRGCYGEHFKYAEYGISLYDHWRARLTHLTHFLDDPGLAIHQITLALQETEENLDLQAAFDLLFHLWNSGWIPDRDVAAVLLWNLMRAQVAELPLEAIQMEMNLIQTETTLGVESLVPMAAAFTRNRGVSSFMYERRAGRWYGKTNISVLRSASGLGHTKPFLDILHLESLVYDALAYLLREAYLLEHPDSASLEDFIQENDTRREDLQAVLRLGHEAPVYAELIEAIADRRWEDARAMLDDRGPTRLGRPLYFERAAERMVDEERSDPDALIQIYEGSMSQGQRFAQRFGRLTRRVQSRAEAEEVFSTFHKPY